MRLVPVIARDTYLRGRGHLLVKLLDLFTIEDGMGDEYDTGELVTYLNDAVMIAPSMLFVREISFSPVDANSFAVSLTDHGRTVTARVTVDKNDRCEPEGSAHLTGPMRSSVQPLCLCPDSPGASPWTPSPAMQFGRPQGGRALFDLE